MSDILADPNVIEAIRDLLLALVTAVIAILGYHRSVTAKLDEERRAEIRELWKRLEGPTFKR